MQELKEKPIIFSTEMVQAILAGIKTQTRRIAKGNFSQSEYEPDFWSIWDIKKGISSSGRFGMVISKYCPYKIDQVLWVKETHKRINTFTVDENEIVYKADFDKHDIKWTPSIYMPRWAARIFLKVKDIRIERIQDISGEDIEAEGINIFKKRTDDDIGFYYEVPANWKNPKGKIIKKILTDSQEDAFCNLWDSINEKRGFGWDKNPYVFIIEFERILNYKGDQK